MATIKSFTDIEKSCKLAEILPLESADAFYVIGDEPVDIAVIYGFVTHKHLQEQVAYKRAVPCWSLSALLEIIPQEISDGYIINITEGGDNRWVLTYDNCMDRCHSYYGLSAGDDNLIDACVEMIIKLHELKML